MTKNKFTLRFTLKQHTPIIHFQADQEGATLRASELKPKLDRFVIGKLIKKIEPDTTFKERYKNWLTGKGEHLSLNYKVKVTSSKIEFSEIQDRSSLFFGNMGEENKTNPKKYSFTNEPVFVDIFCLNTALMEKIEKWFPEFIAINNFGTRQSKGFGSFFLIDNELKQFDFFKILKKSQKAFIFFKLDKSVLQPHEIYFKNIENVFSKIGVVYSLMKSGFNFPDYKRKREGGLDIEKGKGEYQLYFRSYLFQYVIAQYRKRGEIIGSEKRFIKERFFQPRVRIPDDEANKKYIRALLGVSGSVEFKDNNRRGIITYRGENVERFKSPITIKIVNGYVVFIPKQEELKQILDETFHFEDSRHGLESSINVPDNFQLNDFLFSYVDYFNRLEIKKVDSNRRQPRPYKILVNTLNDITLEKHDEF